MKTTTFFMLLIIWISPIYSMAQQVDISWGPEQKIESDNDRFALIGPDGSGGTYELKEVNSALARRSIRHYNSDGKLINSKKFRIKNEGGTQYFGGILYNKGNMYLITYRFSIRGRINSMCIQEIDPFTLEVSDKVKTLAEAPYRWTPFQFYNQYYLKEVDDKIYVLNVAPEKEKDGTILCIYVFDRGFNFLWKHCQELETKRKLFQLEEFDVAPDGTVTVLASVFKDKRIKVRQGKPNYKYQFFFISDSGKNFRIRDVALEDKLITDMRFSYLANGDIACAGFYSNKYSWTKTNTIAGAFYKSFNSKSTKIKIENYKEFESEFLSKFMGEEDAEEGKEIKNIQLYNLQFMNDGSIIVLAEEFNQYQSAFTFMWTSRTETSTHVITTTTTTTVKTTNFNYNNIVVLKIDPKGNIKWNRMIPKRQKTNSRGIAYVSFAPVIVDDKVYLIYNDNPKNLIENSGRVYSFRNNKEAVVVCAAIDSKGDLQREVLFSAKEAGTLICPRSCSQTDENIVKLYGKKKNKYKWGLLEFIR